MPDAGGRGLRSHCHHVNRPVNKPSRQIFLALAQERCRLLVLSRWLEEARKSLG